MEVVKKHAQHGFTQFRLTQNLLNNLSQFVVSPTAKLVLLELSACFNAKTQEMFPKQKTIALKIGCSERSVIRAVQELVKAGVIIAEGKYTYKYKFSQNTLNLCGIVKLLEQPDKLSKDNGTNGDKLSPNTRQFVTQQPDKLSPTCIEPIKEHKKKPTVVNNSIEFEGFKILKSYAVQKGAKNVQAYIAKLKETGADKRIIADYKAKRGAEEYAKNQIKQTLELVKTYNTMTSEPPTESWKELRKVLMGM